MGGVYAAEFSITSVNQQSSGLVYRGDSVSFKGIVQAGDNTCKIECSYQVGSDSGYVSDSGGAPATQLGGNVPQEFPFSVPAEGVGQVNTNLYVTCTRVTSWIPPCTPQTLPTQNRQISFSFLYPGDGTCTTSKEKCENYGSFLKDDACSCPSTKECRPNGNRNPDSKGCQNYCGNSICEKSEGESCSSCQKDCKKCDLSTCSVGSECEGGYCVWGVCWHSPTRTNDGHCDYSGGENCGNSPADCACQTGQRCSTTTNQCETYCGNGVCETSEAGICKADCKWCGDGVCDSSQKENCKSCEIDCGVCESQKVNEEIQQITKEAVETGLKEASEKQKSITYYGVGAIILVVLVYIIFKIIRSRKAKSAQESHQSEVTETKKEAKKVKKKSSKKGKK